MTKHRARVRIRRTTVAPRPSYSDELALSPAQMKQLQRNLVDGGYYAGAIDGQLTSRTRHALTDFQREYHLRRQRPPEPPDRRSAPRPRRRRQRFAARARLIRRSPQTAQPDGPRGASGTPIASQSSYPYAKRSSTQPPRLRANSSIHA